MKHIKSYKLYEEDLRFGDTQDLSGVTEDDLIIQITLDKWGGFEVGDGEYFKSSDKELFSTATEDTDFFIKTEKNGEHYETTYIPNPFNPKDMTGWDKEWIKAYSVASTSKVTKTDILKFIKDNPKIGIWNIEPRKDGSIVIDDMMWHTLSIGTCANTTETAPEKNKKYAALVALLKKYVKADATK